jgi:deazaflavin-dependent oxidoreductase (nitroreductase family)
MDVMEINRRVIEQFRAGGEIEGMHGDRLLLLTTTGARTGQRRTSPVIFHRDGARLLVIASNMGAPRHPAWYHNLAADPRVHVETVAASYDALAIPLRGRQRERAWAVVKHAYPFLAEHQAKTTRTIPVVALTRAVTSAPVHAGDLVLEPVSPALAAEFTARDFHRIRRGKGWPHEDSLDGLSMIADGGSLGWLVTLDGLVIGECGTHGPVDPDGAVEIGYGLAAPYRGRGYGRALVAALSQWLISRPGVTRVLAHTLPGNTPSRRSLERAGFRLDGEDDGECRYVLPRRTT